MFISFSIRNYNNHENKLFYLLLLNCTYNGYISTYSLCNSRPLRLRRKRQLLYCMCILSALYVSIRRLKVKTGNKKCLIIIIHTHLFQSWTPCQTSPVLIFLGLRPWLYLLYDGPYFKVTHDRREHGRML